MNNFDPIKDAHKKHVDKIRETREKLGYKDTYASWQMRHRHIAYCLLKGTPYKRVEKDCHVKPDWNIVQRYLCEYRNIMKKFMDEKLYVVVDETLSKSQQAVQAGHALAEYLLTHPHYKRGWLNGTLVYLKAGSFQLRTLRLLSNSWVGFYEPDLDNQLTAVAGLDKEGKSKSLLERLSLI